MGAQTDRLLAGMRELNARLCQRPDGPLVFLEYAAGLDRGWFVEVAERLRDAERVRLRCIDVGHVGLRQVAARFGESHPGLDLKKLGLADHRLPDLVADIQDAVTTALPHGARRHTFAWSARQARALSPARWASPCPRAQGSLQFPDPAAHPP